jgi:hypothetical protein
MAVAREVGDFGAFVLEVRERGGRFVPAIKQPMIRRAPDSSDAGATLELS